MKVIVFGSNGMLGKYVSTYCKRQGYNVVEVSRKDIDVSNFDEYSKIDSLLAELTGVDKVINCAGTIKPVANKQDKATTFMVNSVFPNYLARKCFLKKIKCYHVTTDCVFSGKTFKGDYTEEDFPDMFDDYGFSKSIGDHAERYCMVIRTSIIGEELENKRSLLEWAKSQRGKEVSGYVNHYWNGVTCLELARVIDSCRYSIGIKHVFSETVSKDQLLELISDAFSLNLKVNRVAGPEHCNRTISTVTSELSVLPLREQIKKLVGFYEKER
jgi:dTDP-4-dehydrorhamnose reductase